MSSIVELTRHLEALAGAFGKPFGAKTADQMVRGWYRSTVLRDLPDSAVEWAVEQHITQGKRFPVPAEIVALAKKAPTMGVVERKDQIPSDRRCSECLEWWGVHRLILTREGLGPALVTLPLVRHTQACRLAAWQRRWAHFYGYSWVDGPPDAGALEEGASAHLAPGAVQLVDPLPPTAADLAAERQAERERKRAAARSRTPNPYPRPKAPEQLAAVVPAAQRQLEAGEYVPPEEDLR